MKTKKVTLTGPARTHYADKLDESGLTIAMCGQVEALLEAWKAKR